MKRHLLSVLLMLVFAAGAWADEVPGVTVEYIDPGTAAYVQAISAIGKIKFEVSDEERHAVIEFKDAALENVDLGAIAGIGRIAFVTVSEDDIATEIKNIKVEDAAIKVTTYPNPTADHVHISGLQEGQQVRLFTSDGRLMVVGASADVDLSGMHNGLYLLQVGKEVFRIIKK